MRHQILLAALASLTWVGVSDAQTTAAPPVAAPPVAAPTAAAPTPAQQANLDRIKGERETCRSQAQGRGLKGDAVRSAVMECMKQVDPVVAKRMGCAQAARAKNLAGDALKTSVRACMTGAG